MNTLEALPYLEDFHRENGVEVSLVLRNVVTTNRAGRVTGTKEKETLSFVALMDWSPSREKITPFGNPEDFPLGSLAVFKLLASDVSPKDDNGAYSLFGAVLSLRNIEATLKKARFEHDGETYDVLAVKRLVRGGQCIRWDFLVGYE